jgi:hypothetical protein
MRPAFPSYLSNRPILPTMASVNCYRCPDCAPAPVNGERLSQPSVSQPRSLVFGNRVRSLDLSNRPRGGNRTGHLPWFPTCCAVGPISCMVMRDWIATYGCSALSTIFGSVSICLLSVCTLSRFKWTTNKETHLGQSPAHHSMFCR